MIRALRRLARRSIDRGQRLLHPLRRHRARQALGRVRGDTILILCLGNICRSPYAERRLRDEFGGDGPTVASAGFIRPGRPSPPVARRVAMQRGVSLEEHRSVLVTPEMLSRAQLVVVMSSSQGRALRGDFEDVAGEVVLLGDLDPEPIDGRGIADPYGGSEQVFDTVFDRIDRCCRAMVDAMTPR